MQQFRKTKAAVDPPPAPSVRRCFTADGGDLSLIAGQGRAMAKRGSGVARRVAHAGGRKPRGGFGPFHPHMTEPEGRKALRTLRRERRELPAFALSSTEAGVLNSETAAIQILQQALDSASLPHFTPPKIGETESSFKSLGVETVPLTGTKFVKFRQHVKGIPVYGSLVVVELDEAYECVSIDANLATPEDCGRLAKVSPFEASRAVAEEAGYGEEEPPATPVLSYYLARSGRWDLAYMLEAVPLREGRRAPGGRGPRGAGRRAPPLLLGLRLRRRRDERSGDRRTAAHADADRPRGAG